MSREKDTTSLLEKGRSLPSIPRFDSGKGEVPDLEASWGKLDPRRKASLHDLHPYRSKFLPHFVAQVIERWSRPGDWVLDPFCGSGTTLLECALSGRNSIGVDCNEVAVLVSRAKLQEYPESDLEEIRRGIKVLSDPNMPLQVRKESDRLLAAAPRYAERDLWFDPRAVAELSRIREVVDGMPAVARLLGRVLFSSILVACSRQKDEWEPVRVRRDFLPGMACRFWVLKALQALAAVEEVRRLRKPSSHRVIHGDSRSLAGVAPGSVALIVAGPPYLYALDYRRIHLHRLHWLDCDPGWAEGRELAKKRSGEPVLESFRKDLQSCVSVWPQLLQDQGKVVVVLADSVSRGRPVGAVEMLTEMARDCGLILESRWELIGPCGPSALRVARRNGKSCEDVLLFRKGNRRPKAGGTSAESVHTFSLPGGKRILARLNLEVERLFDHARQQGVLVGITGGDAYRALRRRDPTCLTLGSDLDVLLPSDSLLRDRRWKGSGKRRVRTRLPVREPGFFSAQQLLFGKDLQIRFPGISFDPLGSVEGGGRVRTVKGYPSVASCAALLSNGSVWFSEGTFLEDFCGPRLRLRRPTEFPTDPLRYIRLEAEEEELSLEPKTAEMLKRLSWRVFQDPSLQVRITRTEAEQILGYARRRGCLEDVRRVRELCLRRTVSGRDLRDWFGEKIGRELLRLCLNSPLYTLEKYLVKMFLHGREKGRVCARLEEWGWTQELTAMGYDLKGTAQRAGDAVRAGRRLTPDTLKKIVLRNQNRMP